MQFRNTALFILLLATCCLHAQREDNFSLAVKHGVFGITVAEDLPPLYGETDNPRPGFRNRSNFGGVGRKSGLELRYAQSARTIVSFGLHVTHAENDWTGDTFPEDGAFGFPIRESFEFAGVGIDVGGHYRITRPESRIDWQAGVRVGIAFTNYTYRITAPSYDPTPGADASFRRVQNDDGLWRSISPTTRLAFRPLPRLGIAVEANAGLGYDGNGYLLDYGLQLGAFYEFGKN